MKSAALGSSISGPEVTNVSRHGLWLLLDREELFLSYEHFPWFQDAPIGKVLRVEQPSAHHLYWPELDIDLDIESIRHPGKFPLVSRIAG
ncbi:MAG: DUF2442 domain-containing protein [Proteobacteria bacterium]|nr:DUF2442 domain-containing protein [Pseudomonadota bacterium]